MPKPRSLRFLWSAVLLAAFADAQVATSVTLTPSQNPSIFGHAVTLTAAVTFGATGKVAFYDGVNVLGTSTISGSQAMFTTVLLPAGTRQLHAHYLGNSGYASSSSAVVMVTVAAQPSTAFKPRLITSIDARSTLVGDYNGDGKQDMLVYGVGDTAFILLGNGDGTFQTPLYQNVGSLPQAAAMGMGKRTWQSFLLRAIA